MRNALLFSCALFFSLGASIPARADACNSPGSLVANCGFETGDFSGWNTLPPGYNGVWYGVDGTDAYTGSYGAYIAGFGSYATQDGNLAALYQYLATTPGVTYVLTFNLAHFVPDVPPPAPDNAFIFGFDSTLLQEQVNVSNENWIQYRYLFTAASASTALIFEAEDANYFFSMDDVSVTKEVLPEPATCALIVPAAAALYLVRRRKPLAF